MGCAYLKWVLNDFVSKLVVTQNIFLSCPRHFDQGLIVVIVYDFQIWNKREHNIIIIRVIIYHMGPMYIETPYITI